MTGKEAHAAPRGIRKKTPRHAISDAEVDLHDSMLAVVIVPVRARLRGGRTWPAFRTCIRENSTEWSHAGDAPPYRARMGVFRPAFPDFQVVLGADFSENSAV